MSVLLTGFMGAGKSTVGRLVAGRLRMPFLELDDETAKLAGGSIVEVFEAEGEATFRRFESAALAAALAGPDRVIALGGGALIEPRAWKLLGDGDVAVWLNVPFSLICERLVGTGEADRRPLVADRTALEALFESRIQAYERAHLRIDVAGRETPKEVASRIVGAFERYSCATS